MGLWGNSVVSSNNRVEFLVVATTVSCKKYYMEILRGTLMTKRSESFGCHHSVLNSPRDCLLRTDRERHSTPKVLMVIVFSACSWKLKVGKVFDLKCLYLIDSFCLGNLPLLNNTSMSSYVLMIMMGGNKTLFVFVFILRI